MSDIQHGCPQPQCQDTKPMALHAGYVAHKSRGEEACPASAAGHNEYVRLNRLRKQAARDRVIAFEDALDRNTDVNYQRTNR